MLLIARDLSQPAFSLIERPASQPWEAVPGCRKTIQAQDSPVTGLRKHLELFLVSAKWLSQCGPRRASLTPRSCAPVLVAGVPRSACISLQSLSKYCGGVTVPAHCGRILEGRAWATPDPSCHRLRPFHSRRVCVLPVRREP